MNKMIKNIFVATAITITFAPASHCTSKEVQAKSQISKGRLQSAIDYVKNIRSPLTPQEKLAQHIAHADVTGFKTAYDAFVQSDIAAAERATMTQELTANAQEMKQQLQSALDAMGDTQVNKKMLAKGAAQSVASSALLISGACFARLMYKNIVNRLPIQKENTLAYCSLPALISFLPIVYLISPLVQNNNSKEAQLIRISSILIHILANTALGSYGLKSGMQNCKNGWNYQAYLQQQIKNVDEIREYIAAK